MSAFAVGALAGAVVALLTAPRTGPESREAISTWSKDVRHKASLLPNAIRRAREAGRSAFAEAYHVESPRNYS